MRMGRRQARHVCEIYNFYLDPLNNKKRRIYGRLLLTCKPTKNLLTKRPFRKGNLSITRDKKVKYSQDFA